MNKTEQSHYISQCGSARSLVDTAMNMLGKLGQSNPVGHARSKLSDARGHIDQELARLNTLTLSDDDVQHEEPEPKTQADPPPVTEPVGNEPEDPPVEDPVETVAVDFSAMELDPVSESPEEDEAAEPDPT